MPLVRRLPAVLATLAAYATLSALGVTGALAAPPGLVGLKYRIKDMPAGSELRIGYGPSVTQSSEGTAIAHNGGISTVEFLNHSLLLFASRPAALDATVVQLVFVDEATVTGDAHLPKGASVTLTNLRTQKTIDLHDGKFSIPSGVKPTSASRARASALALDPT
jgi:hypothetical protein